MSDTKFATFWHGREFPLYDVACLSSFPAYGSEISVYSYNPISNLPKGVIEKDARSILSIDSLNDFIVDGVPSTPHFVDYFRLVMFTKTEEIWADTDILLLRGFDMDVAGDVIGREKPDLICSALLRLDPLNPRLHDLIQRVEAMKKTNTKFPAIDRNLLTEIYGVASAQPENVFFPINSDSYYKVFLPQYFEECAALCANSYTLHLWNERMEKMGVFKQVCPPEGSFLHHVFARTGADQLFNEIYPEEVMQRLVSNTECKIGRNESIRKFMRVAFGSHTKEMHM